MTDEHINTSVSVKKTKQLFFNGQDATTEKLFRSVSALPVVQPQEVRQEAAPVNPYAELEARNAEMDRIRLEAAMQSDGTQTLLKPPTKVSATTTETVSLEELPALVRQAAEASLKKRLGLPPR